MLRPTKLGVLLAPSRRTLASLAAEVPRVLTTAAPHDATAAAELRQAGYVVVRLGPKATAQEMERAARSLMGEASGSYNGAGGVTRQAIGDSNFLNAAEGAPATLRIQFHNEMAYAMRYPAPAAAPAGRPPSVGFFQMYLFLHLMASEGRPRHPLYP